SPDSLSAASSPSASAGSPSSSPVKVDRGFLSPASLVTKSPLSAAAMSTPASVSTVGDLRGLAASSLDSLKCRLDALHLPLQDLQAHHDAELRANGGGGGEGA
uniref:Uncharacterized protein n=1 Tax=Aegilops tauschii subsp. strangulata TaxID=200361 RepID=A0A453TC21_AEGTS